MILRGASLLLCNSFACGSTSTYYSNSFEMGFAQVFGIWLKGASASSTPNLQIQFEQSYQRPTTEGSSDTSWIIGDGVPDIYTTLNDEIAHIKSVACVPSQYGRLKIIGNTGNPSDSLLTAVIFIQEIA